MSEPINFETLKKIILEINPSVESWLKEPKTDLFKIGALDSVSIIELIPILEKKFGFEFDFTDLRSGHFRNLLALERLLKEKYGIY